MNNYYCWLLVLLTGFTTPANAQTPPEWTRTINVVPDSSPVYPVRMTQDMNGNCNVLSTYQKSISPTNIIHKIVLTQFDYNGNTNWQLIFDNNGTGNPRGFDMATDANGNCYIAGAFMATTNFEPILLKVNAGGSVAWQHVSTAAFQTGYFDQVILKNNFLFLKGSNGVAVFDVAGNERWSLALTPQAIAVDDSGRMVLSAFTSGIQTLFRYNFDGSFSFSDSTIMAKKIVCDSPGNIYLLADNPMYSLVKYDSNGQFSWSRDSLAAPTPFGDIGLDLLRDDNGDLLLVGLQDSILKFSDSGNLIWRAPMQGADAYRISAKMISSGVLAVAGSIPGFAGYDMSVSTYNLYGQQSWTGYFSGNTGGREFTWDLAADGNGIYVIEDNENFTTLVKFTNPAFTTALDYTLICVDSVWYDPLNPLLINVTVFNGNNSHVNYPSIRIVSPAGDTIGNPNNFVNYFAHLGNIYQTYTDTITVAGITDFSNYAFFMSEGFGDTIAQIQFCTTTGLAELQEPAFLLYPNPAHAAIHIVPHPDNTGTGHLLITNMQGETMFENSISSATEQTIDVSSWAGGIYIVKCESNNRSRWMKFMK